jgi:hypothetical protein
MGFIGNVVGAGFRALVAPIAQSAIRAIAPGATDLLKKIVGTGFDVVKFAAPFAVQGILPGPLGMIAGALLGPVMGKGVDALKNLTTNGIENFVRQVVGQPQDRELVGSPTGNNITLPSLGQVATNYAASSIGTSLANTVSNFLGGGGDVESQLANAAQGLREPSFPGANASEGDLLKYQADLQKYARLMDMYSKIIQAHHDMKKGIIANFRV